MDHFHSRLKLEDFGLAAPRVGQCEAQVKLGWGEGESFVGLAEGRATPQGRLRCAAEATSRALELATHERVALEVLPVKAMEGFDTIIVVVSLSSKVADHAERLVGSCLIKGEPTRGAVLATLSATNRLLGRVFAS